MQTHGFFEFNRLCKRLSIPVQHPGVEYVSLKFDKPTILNGFVIALDNVEHVHVQISMNGHHFEQKSTISRSNSANESMVTFDEPIDLYDRDTSQRLRIESKDLKRRSFYIVYFDKHELESPYLMNHTFSAGSRLLYTLKLTDI